MKRRLTILTGLTLMAVAIFGTGCAPAPYHGGYYPPEIIIVYEPVPYPVPGDDYLPSPPPPPRHTPLTPASDSGNPRIKTPRKERSDDRVTTPRTRPGNQSLAQQAGHQTTRDAKPKRR